jgi:hypothetical protein
MPLLWIIKNIIKCRKDMQKSIQIVIVILVFLIMMKINTASFILFEALAESEEQDLEKSIEELSKEIKELKQEIQEDKKTIYFLIFMGFTLVTILFIYIYSDITNDITDNKNNITYNKNDISFISADTPIIRADIMKIDDELKKLIEFKKAVIKNDVLIQDTTTASLRLDNLKSEINNLKFQVSVLRKEDGNQ